MSSFWYARVRCVSTVRKLTNSGYTGPEPARSVPVGHEAALLVGEGAGRVLSRKDAPAEDDSVGDLPMARGQIPADRVCICNWPIPPAALCALLSAICERVAGRTIGAVLSPPHEEGKMQTALLDIAGHRRSPVTMPGFHEGRTPRNKGTGTRRTHPRLRRSSR
jgi:hypothetical protein